MSYREIPEDKILKFPSTAGFKGWKPFFTDESITHPAKMNLRLLSWILETYTKPGDVVLDPMSGTGSTAILASIFGRNAISVEYEPAFHRLMVGFHPCDGWQCQECQRRESEKNRLDEEINKLRNLLVNSLSETKEDYMPVEEIEELIGIKEKVLRGYPWGYNPPNVLHEVDGNLDLLNTQSSLRPRGWIKCIQGDARELSKLLRESDVIITSPPYSGNTTNKRDSDEKLRPNRSYRLCGVFGESKENIGNLPHGDVDVVVTSPPYERSYLGGEDEEERKKRLIESGHDVKDFFGGKARGVTLKHYDEVDVVVTSPPYGNRLSDEAVQDGDEDRISYRQAIDSIVTSPPYEAGPFNHAGGHGGAYAGGIAERDPKLKPPVMEKDNIGNLKTDSYLSAMLQVYRECFKVGGKLILVTKNFIRDKQVVRLDLDTIKLCEAAGFRLSDRWYFKLPTKSFWRILYRRKYPDVPEVEHEDVLIFTKEADE